MQYSSKNGANSVAILNGQNSSVKGRLVSSINNSPKLDIKDPQKFLEFVAMWHIEIVMDSDDLTFEQAVKYFFDEYLKSKN